MLLTSRSQDVPDITHGAPFQDAPFSKPSPYRSGDHSKLATGWSAGEERAPALESQTREAHREDKAGIQGHLYEVDPLYLFACYQLWEQTEEPSAAWELLQAERSDSEESRAQARALMAQSRHFNTGLISVVQPADENDEKRNSAVELDMKSPYGLEIMDHCAECGHVKGSFFCGFSEDALRRLNRVSHKNVLPAGALLFVEGQTPRGAFIICSGKVNLSTTSREGKVLTLKTVGAGEILGLSAAISNVNYETTAETATPCQVSFVERNHIVELLESHGEIGVQIARCLSRNFQAAYREIRDLVTTRSSAGKLARLLLSQSYGDEDDLEARVHSAMTHEEMAQRIGASRETVTRLLSDLRRKKLIRSDGPTLVIRDRGALQALTV